MSEATTMYIFLPEGVDRIKAVWDTDKILLTNKAEMDLDENSLFFLGTQVDDEEYEEYFIDDPQEITDKEEMLWKIIDWPTMGSTDYIGVGGVFDVGFYAFPEQKVECISLGILWSKSFYQNKESQEWFTKVGKELHEHFTAKRSIMTWGINTIEGFTLKEELQRLKSGVVDKSFNFDYFDWH